MNPAKGLVEAIEIVARGTGHRLLFAAKVREAGEFSISTISWRRCSPTVSSSSARSRALPSNGALLIGGALALLSPRFGGGSNLLARPG